MKAEGEQKESGQYGRDPFRNELMRKSFFKPFERGDLYHPVEGSRVAADPAVRAKVLAEAIPALSRATGANPVDGFFLDNNVDMMTTMKNGWPAGRMNSDHKLNNWLHGDFRDVGYFFVYRLYDDICTRGVLR